MKKEFILLILTLMAVNEINGEEINFIYPDSVIVGKEFNVTVELINFSRDIYDVKIDILNGTTHIAKIFYENWKSSRYWIKDCINNSEKEKTFRMNITQNYDGNNTMILKIRNSSDFVYRYTYNISISFNENLSLKNLKNFSEIPKEEISQITLSMSWDEEDIVNGKNFKIILKAFNLGNKSYDVKVWIESEKSEKIISERYDGNKWKSGNYYAKDFFQGPGNVSKKIKLRIKESYRDFKGSAKIFFKIREGIKIEEDIEILEKDLEKEKNEEKIEEQKFQKKVEVSEEIIQLGKKKQFLDLKSISNEKQENIKTLIYKSKIEIIKEYAIFSFALLCVILSILINWKKLE